MSSSSDSSSKAGSGRDRPVILIADDDPGIRNLLRLTFENAGFDVVEAASGTEAAARAAETRPDVFVTDLAMPDGEGLETLRRFQQEFPSILTVAISGAFSGGVLRSALYFGARAVMQKPIRASKLVEMVTVLMAGGSLVSD
jgi:CheY-like chemotaxis protein